MPRIAVIIPAYNAAPYLPLALNSLLRQSYRDWEAVVVDDGSTDGTAALMQGRDWGPKIRYLFQANRGAAAARNTGIQASDSDLIALLDADDIFLEPRLERGAAVLEADRGAGLVHANIAMIGSSGEFLQSRKFPEKYLSGRIARHIYRRRARIAPSTVLFRRACVERAGLFDETLRVSEDRDLWFRIARHYRFVYLPEVLAYYRRLPTSLTGKIDRVVEYQLAFIGKHRESGVRGALDFHLAYGSICREMGDALFNARDRRAALGWYGKALAHQPNLKNLYMTLRGALKLAASGAGEEHAHGERNHSDV
ncbi:MAG TPA: glycosyltransferase [Bryobacteraceae bacterium]|jgi:glycosyltransferase involved in cell wall biosynthesis|nr:glycosyltransferase [Bryobacteraceae bacterium]